VVEDSTLAILKRAKDRGEIVAAVPDWWLLSTFLHGIGTAPGEGTR
jgi:hypothetical protein